MMNNIGIAVIIFARNEAPHIRDVIEALKLQSLKPVSIILVDDQSTDDTAAIAKKAGAIVVRSPYRHEESWVDKPMLARLPNLGLRYIYRRFSEIDYLMIVGGDTVITDRAYTEKVIKEMRRRKCVIASGIIVGEEHMSDLPRGSGRIYDFKWFASKIRYFPEIYGWEAYVVYKALSMGYNVCVVRNAVMRVKRPTRIVKPLYALNMKSLGYHPLYAILRTLSYMRIDMINAFRMLMLYLIEKTEPYDQEVAEWIRKYQKNKIKEKIKIIIKPYRRLRSQWAHT